MKTQTPQASTLIIKKINQLELQTKRLSLRKFSANDCADNVRDEMDAEIMRYIRDLQSYQITLEKTLEKVKDWSGEELDWALISLIEKSTNSYAGIVCFRYESIENNTIEMGWRLGHDFQGRGLATEASQAFLNFIKEEIKPHKVMAYCVKENTASSRIMQKLGMQQEGCLKEFSKLGGRWFDEAIYGIILN